MQNDMVLCLYCEYFRENMNFLIRVDKWVYFVNVSMLHILILLLAVFVCFVSQHHVRNNVAIYSIYIKLNLGNIYRFY